MPYDSKAKEAARSRRARARAAAKGGWQRVPSNLPSVAAKDNRAVGIVQALDIPVPKAGLRIATLCDTQVMDGVDMRHLSWYGRYLAAKQPDVIVCIGDFGDFPSLSQFERGTMQFEGRRFKKDLAAFHRGMDLFMAPIAKAKGYHPHLEFTHGNHESHIERAVNEDAKLEGLMSLEDLRLKDYGWREHRFLQPVSIGGVAFCHYFPSGVMGRPITTAAELLRKLHMSAFAGHQQGREIAFGRRADGAHMTAIISGSFYQHDYKYLSPFTNGHWRGTWVLHQVKGGAFDEMALSIEYLKRKFA